jgi:hypothetical protein
VLAATASAVGESFGLVAFPIELPTSTVIMLHSIGDIARAEGEDQSDPETALSCLHVLALGGLKGKADVANSGYFAVRGLLAKPVAEVARFTVPHRPPARAYSPSADWNGAWKDAIRAA